MESIWKTTTRLEKRAPFWGEKEVHTVVIGAGMAGILTAYFLQKKGIEVIVVEAKSIASGQTQNTTAKITSQHGMKYKKMLYKVGRERAKAYAMANEEAIHLYEKLIKEEGIDCHFEKLPAYLYSEDEETKTALQEEARVAAELGISASYLEGKEITELPFPVSGAVCFANQAQFHPLEFIKHLAKEITVYEDTRVLSVKKHVVYTDKGDIQAKHIVFATHYPFINVPGFYFLREHQERSYVLALKGQQKLSGMYYSIDKGGLSLRSAGDVLLLGGGGHRTGKSHICQCGRTEEKESFSRVETSAGKPCQKQAQSNTGYEFLKQKAKNYYPRAEVVTAWSAQDCMPHDDIPFIGKYSVLRPFWYVATGFQKWGMTSAMIAAVTISNQICGADGLYETISHENIAGKSVFAPQRCLIKAAFKNLMKEVGESVLGLSKGLFCKKERRCPHMGCRLEWNAEEGTWECPCHGSRFSGGGELLDNPAQMDLGKEE